MFTLDDLITPEERLLLDLENRVLKLITMMACMTVLNLRELLSIRIEGPSVAVDMGARSM